MSPVVDYFVIAESELTFTGNKKQKFFTENYSKFAAFKDKIIHLVIPPKPFDNAWDAEYYQRNYLKQALKGCHQDDLIIISDTDEIVNIDYIVNNYNISSPCLIDIPLYYYFYNLKVDMEWQFVLITPYSFIEKFDIGNRLNYQSLNPLILKNSSPNLGWHFSYLFGYDIDLYKEKVKSFSHQEYNTPYYLDDQKIERCILFGYDLFERSWYQLRLVNDAIEFDKRLLSILSKLQFDKKFKLNRYKQFIYGLNYKNTTFVLKHLLKKVKFMVMIKDLIYSK